MLSKNQIGTAQGFKGVIAYKNKTDIRLFSSGTEGFFTSSFQCRWYGNLSIWQIFRPYSFASNSSHQANLYCNRVHRHSFYQNAADPAEHIHTIWNRFRVHWNIKIAPLDHANPPRNLLHRGLQTAAGGGIESFS